MSTTYYVWEKWSVSSTASLVQSGSGQITSNDIWAAGGVYIAYSYEIYGTLVRLAGNKFFRTSIRDIHTQDYTLLSSNSNYAGTTLYYVTWSGTSLDNYVLCDIYTIQTTTVKGSTYYGTVKSTNANAYPNGGASGGYWYSNRQSIAMPDTYAKQNGAWVASPDRLDKQNGAWKSGYELYKQNGAWVV